MLADDAVISFLPLETFFGQPQAAIPANRRRSALAG